MGKVGHMPLTQSTLPLPPGVGEGEAPGLSPCLWPQLDSWFRLKEAGGPMTSQYRNSLTQLILSSAAWPLTLLQV